MIERCRPLVVKFNNKNYQMIVSRNEKEHGSEEAGFFRWMSSKDIHYELRSALGKDYEVWIPGRHYAAALGKLEELTEERLH